MINFVMHNGGYKKVIESFINPILPHLDNYKITTKAENNVINVIFFTEEGHFKNIGAKDCNGKNIFMTHGIADKNWRTAKKTNKFDYVFVTGDLWVDKLVSQGMDINKIRINGYTRMEEIFKNQKEYIKQNYNKKTILFAPTHNTSITTYKKLDLIIDRLRDDYNVIVSEHPANKNNNEITSNQYLEADIVVGDFGSSMYEGWALNKPCILADWIMKDDISRIYPNSFEEYIYKNNIGYHAKNEDDFINLIDLAIQNGIKSNSKKFIDGIFKKELRGCSGKQTANILKEIEKEL